MLLTPHLIASDSRNYDQTLRRPQLWGQKIYLVPRSECAFRRIQLKGKGRPALLAAKLQMSREALDPDSYVHIVRDKLGSEAGAWIFSKTRPSGTRYLPESLAYTSGGDGARLLSLSQGFEGQVWSEGALIASRWWGKQPSQSDWDVFLRASNIEHVTPQTPEAQSVKLRDDIPFLDLSRDYLLEVFSPKRLIIAIGFIALAFTCFLGTKFLRYTLLYNQIQAETATVSQTAEQILSQRRRALKNIQQTRKLQTLGDEGQIITALYGVSAALKQQGLTLISIKVQDNELDLVLSGDKQLTIPEIVTRLEAVPSLTNVSASVDFRNALEVKATLQPFKMPDSFIAFETRGEKE